MYWLLDEAHDTRAVTLRVPVLEKWSGQNVDFLLVLSLYHFTQDTPDGQLTSPFIVQFVFHFSLKGTR